MDCQSLGLPPINTTTAVIGLRQSPDGAIHLSLAQLHLVSFRHLISGLDENVAEPELVHAMSTSLTGYTEWLSLEQPVISLGWDWQLDSAGIGMQLSRVGEPRSNMMLADTGLGDLSYAQSTKLLEKFVDQLNWQDCVFKAIEIRYQK